MPRRILQGTLVGFLIALVSGTLADQITRNFTRNATIVGLVWIALVIACAFGYRKIRTSSESNFESFEISHQHKKYFGLIALAAGAIAVILKSMPHGNHLFLVAKVVAVLVAAGGVAGFFYAQGLPAENNAAPSLKSITETVNSTVLAGCAFVAALLASMTYRTSTDDFYYVNLSTYIYDHGIIPVRDTVLSDQYFTGYARMSSWEVLWGVFARFIHVHPTLLLYVVFVPLATALSIYVLSLLMEAMGIRHANLALVASTVFLIFDGVQGFTFGAYQGPRIWQGKSFFLAVLIPLLLLTIIRLLRSKNFSDAVLLVAVVVASLGASTTVFIIGLPMLGVALVLACVNRSRHQIAASTISIAYLVTCALLFKRMLDASNTASVSALGRGFGVGIRNAKYTTHDAMPQSYDLLTKLSGPAWHSALFAIAAVLGWIALRGKFSREVVALNFAAWGLISTPVVLKVYMTLTGSAPIAWRYIWLVPIPLLIGATASTLYDGIWLAKANNNVRAGVAVTWIALLAVLPMTLGTPPWKIAPGSLVSADLSKPGAYRVGFGYAQTEKALAKVAKPGDTVLARNGISASINTQTTNFYTVGLRPVYVEHATNGFKDGFAQERVDLSLYVGNLTKKPLLTDAQLALDLNRVRVNVVCIAKEQKKQIPTFKKLGYTEPQKKVSKSDGRIWVWCGRTSAFDK